VAVSAPLVVSLRSLWLAVPLLGLTELGAHLYLARRAPTVAEWQTIHDPVARMRTGSEPVVVAPYWAEPLARRALGDGLMPIADVARPDLTAVARAVEVSILGQEAPELVGWSTTQTTSLGAFRIRMRHNPTPASVRFDFVTGLDPTRVWVEDADGYACRYNPRARRETGGLHGHAAFPEQRFECPGSSHFFVGVTVIEDERYRPRRCIWAHPTTRGPLLIRYQDVPLGRVIQGHGGLSWFLMRDGAGTPVELSVRVGGERIGSVVHHDTQGWHRFELPLGRHAGTRADVQFEVASESARERHYCFHADTR
jgi:hypothetical protein